VAPDGGTFDVEEEALARRVADFIVRRRMVAPALMVLESGRPLNFVGSQVLVFLSPFLTFIFSRDEYDGFARFLEKRRSVDVLIDMILEGETSHNG